MTSTATKPTEKPTLPNNGVLFDEDYRRFIWRLLADLEAERIKIADLQSKVQAYVARVAELERRIR